MIMSKLNNRAINCEESPGSIGQGRWITPSGGDSKESATEINRLLSGKGGKVR